MVFDPVRVIGILISLYSTTMLLHELGHALTLYTYSKDKKIGIHIRLFERIIETGKTHQYKILKRWQYYNVLFAGVLTGLIAHLLVLYTYDLVWLSPATLIGYLVFCKSDIKEMKKTSVKIKELEK